MFDTAGFGDVDLIRTSGEIRLSNYCCGKMHMKCFYIKHSGMILK